MSVSVGKLNIEVNVQLAKMQAQFDQLNRKTKDMARKQKSAFSGMAGSVKASMGLFAAALAPTAILGFIKSLAGMGSEIVHLATASGIAASDFAALGMHFQGADITLQDLSKAFVRLQKATFDVQLGNKLLGDSFGMLGIDASKLQKLPLQEQLEVLSIAMVNTKDHTAAVGAIMAILGTKQGPKLLSSLRELGTDGLDHIKGLYKELVPTDEDLAMIEKATTQVERMITRWQNLALKGLAKQAKFSWVEQIVAELALQYGVKLNLLPKIDPAKQAKVAAAAATFAKEQEEKLKSVKGVTPMAALDRENAAKAGQALRDLALKEYAQLQKIKESITREMQQHDDEVEALAEKYRDMANPLRQYEAELIKIDTLKRAGIITDKEAAASLAAVQKDMEEKRKQILKDAEGADVTAAQKAMTDSLNQMWNNVSDRAGQAFADMVLTGKASFADLADIISRTMIEIVARMAIINPLMNALFGGFNGFGILPAFFGPGAKLAGAKADGGPVRGGRSYLVGEQGPEIFTPNSMGAIIPNGAAVASGGGGSPTFIYNIGSGVTQSQLMPILRNQERTIISKINDSKRRR